MKEKEDQTILVIEDKEGKLFEDLLHLKTGCKVERVDFLEAPQALKLRPPHLVIFNLDHQKEEAKKILKSFGAALPETFWAITSMEVTTEELVDFFRLGAADYLPQPFCEREAQDFFRRMDHLKIKKIFEPKQENHRMISVFSSKGGVGVSFLAANLAVSMAQKKGGRILLADWVFQHGNLSDLLDMDPSFTFVDLMQSMERLDEKFLENSLPKHRSGVFLLARPKNPEDAERLSGQELGPVLKQLKNFFDCIVFDAGHEFNNASIACLDLSEFVLPVTTPELASLCNTRHALQTFEKLGYGKEKVKLILNRWHMKGEIDESTIEKNICYPIFHKFGDDPEPVLSSMNRGIPFVELEKHSKLKKSFEQLTQELSPLTVPVN